MSDKVGKGIATRIDVCGILTGSLVHRCVEPTLVIPFNTLYQTNFHTSRDEGVLNIASRLVKRCSGGTTIGAPIQYLLESRTSVDTLIGITDNEDWCYSIDYHWNNLPFKAQRKAGPFIEMWRKYKKEVNPKCKAFLLTVSPHQDAVAPIDEPDVHYIYGWTDDMLRFISGTLNGIGSQVDEVLGMEL